MYINIQYSTYWHMHICILYIYVPVLDRRIIYTLLLYSSSGKSGTSSLHSSRFALIRGAKDDVSRGP